MNMIFKQVLATCFLISTGALTCADEGAASTALSGAEIARTIDVDFGPLPAGWVKETNVMDPIWQPLGLRGVNYYAYGGPTKDGSPAARLDIKSSAYQAWFGVYVIALDSATKVRLDSIENAVRVADLDQRSWLQAMGDPQPLGIADATEREQGSALIKNRRVPVFSYEGGSHSDIGGTDTPLRRHLLGKNEAVLDGNVKDFHPLTLRGDFAFFADQKLRVAVIIYSAAPLFQTADGKTHDFYAPLKSTFVALMRSVRLRARDVR